MSSPKVAGCEGFSPSPQDKATDGCSPSHSLRQRQIPAGGGFWTAESPRRGEDQDGLSQSHSLRQFINQVVTEFYVFLLRYWVFIPAVPGTISISSD